MNVYLLMIWLSTSLNNFLGLVINSSSSFMDMFMKAAFVGANTVQGPAVKENKVEGQVK